MFITANLRNVEETLDQLSPHTRGVFLVDDSASTLFYLDLRVKNERQGGFTIYSVGNEQIAKTRDQLAAWSAAIKIPTFPVILNIHAAYLDAYCSQDWKRVPTLIPWEATVPAVDSEDVSGLYGVDLTQPADFQRVIGGLSRIDAMDTFAQATMMNNGDMPSEPSLATLCLKRSVKSEDPYAKDQWKQGYGQPERKTPLELSRYFEPRPVSMTERLPSYLSDYRRTLRDLAQPVAFRSGMYGNARESSVTSYPRPPPSAPTPLAEWRYAQADDFERLLSMINRRTAGGIPPLPRPDAPPPDPQAPPPGPDDPGADAGANTDADEKRRSVLDLPRDYDDGLFFQPDSVDEARDAAPMSRSSVQRIEDYRDLDEEEAAAWERADDFEHDEDGQMLMNELQRTIGGWGGDWSERVAASASDASASSSAAAAAAIASANEVREMYDSAILSASLEELDEVEPPMLRSRHHVWNTPLPSEPRPVMAPDQAPLQQAVPRQRGRPLNPDDEAYLAYLRNG